MAELKPCKICKDRRRNLIEKDRGNGTSWAKMHKKYRLSIPTLRKHFKVCLKNQIQAKEEADKKSKEIIESNGVSNDPGRKLQAGNLSEEIESVFTLDRLIERMRRVYDYADKMLEAVNEYLLDPDDPSQYFIGPRAEEIDILYMQYNPETRRPMGTSMKKAPLQELLNVVESSGEYVIHRIDTKMADPRKLLLDFIKAIGQLNRDLIDTRNKDISWALEYEKIQMEKEAISRNKGEGMSTEEQLKEIAKMLGSALNTSEDKELIKKLGLPE